MKLLQIEDNGKLLKVPEVLEIDVIIGDKLFCTNEEVDGLLEDKNVMDLVLSNVITGDSSYFGTLSDCYRQAPLHKVGNSDIYDFDLFDNQGSVHIAIYNYDFDLFQVFDIEKVITPTKIGQWVENYQDRSYISKDAIPLDSIFSKENKLKYPQVYSKAVKLIQGSICKQ